MPQHNHGHSHEDSDQQSNDEGDIYTKLATFFGGVADIVTSYYYVTELVALLDRSEDSASMHARVIGSVASLTALVSMYTHYKLYTFHQVSTPKEKKENEVGTPASLPNSRDEENPTLVRNPEQKTPPVTSINSTDTQTSPLLGQAPLHTPLLKDDSKLHLHNHDGKHPTKHKRRNCSNRLRQAALISDGVTHTLGLSGTLAAVVNGVGGPFSFWEKVAVHGVSLTAGFFGSLAQVRNEADALKKLADSEEEVSEEEHHPEVP